jgi:hypothetical protein
MANRFSFLDMVKLNCTFGFKQSIRIFIHQTQVKELIKVNKRSRNCEVQKGDE